VQIPTILIALLLLWHGQRLPRPRAPAVRKRAAPRNA